MAPTFVTSTRDNAGRDLVVEVRTSDGYFNATKMCDSSGKEWFGYKRNNKTKDFLEKLAAAERISGEDLVQTKVTCVRYKKRHREFVQRSSPSPRSPKDVTANSRRALFSPVVARKTSPQIRAELFSVPS